MNWTAIVPLNYGRECKTRLASRLTSAERTALVERMARHVLAQLAATPSIGSVHVLSPVRPPFASGNWIEDKGRGLNAELAAARTLFPGEPVLFIHADLPFLTADDVQALLDAAEQSGAALAPDEAGKGTNALAIANDRPLSPAFGVDSLATHRALLPDAALVTTPGLSCDIDEPEALDLARAKGATLFDG